ncbi:MAG: tryptophan--tRNA ligase, partial [Oscillospiraceae bacterium]
KKMSKSDPNPKSYVAVLDSRDTIIKKFKSAVTDSGDGIYRSEEKAGISNLMTIYSVFTGKSDEEIVSEFAGRGYGDFKLAVGESVADTLNPIKERFDTILKDKAYLEKCYTEGNEAAMQRSEKILNKVYKKVGFGI